MRPRRAMWRRRLLFAAACLLLGAVTTVGVAWGFAARTHVGVSAGGAPVIEGAWPLPGAVGEAGEKWSEVARVQRKATLGVTRVRAYGEGGAEAVADGGEGRGEGEKQLAAQIGCSYGLPLRCLYVQRAVSWTEGGTAPCLNLLSTDGLGEGGWPEGIAVPRSISGPRTALLPTLPLWGGLLVNVGVYAAAWWALLAAPGFVRRRLRRGRGVCVACGYDLRGLGGGGVCPECGRGGASGGTVAVKAG